MKPATASCSCPEHQEFDGKRYPLSLDADCKQHSYPAGEWRAGSPLRAHALEVERSTGWLFPRHEAHALAKDPHGDCDGGAYMRLFRTETPREVEARLRSELTS